MEILSWRQIIQMGTWIDKWCKCEVGSTIRGWRLPEMVTVLENIKSVFYLILNYFKR